MRTTRPRSPPAGFEVYRRQTEPLVAYYLAQGILVGIDASRTVEQVYEQIEGVLARVEAGS